MTPPTAKPDVPPNDGPANDAAGDAPANVTKIGLGSRRSIRPRAEKDEEELARLRAARVAARVAARENRRGEADAARGERRRGTAPDVEDDADLSEKDLRDLPEADDAPEAEAVALRGADAAPAPARPAPPLPALDDEEEDDEDEILPARRRGRGSRRNAKSSADASDYVVAPAVGPAQMRARHYGVIAAFCLFVLVPTLTYSWYLWTRAVDQYESSVGFGSRTEEGPATFDFLGALGGATSGGAKDMDILNQFVVSQELVARVDKELNLRALWSKAEDDPLHNFNPDGSIEDLVSYWEHMVLVDYDNSAGLMNLRVYAFTPEDAQRIAQAILTASTEIINDLSKTAQEDSTRFSAEMLAATEEKLTEARKAVMKFQVENQIVDPTNMVQNQLSVVATLNQQLAAAQIDLDLLSGTVPATDPRISALNRRLEVIRNRIAEEEAKVGAANGPDQPGFAELMSQFEELKVQMDFAQRAYLSALAAHDQALADAQKKTRYLATFVAPTLAEASTAPSRPTVAAMVALIGFLIWSVVVLTYYSLRDRR